MNRYQEGLMSWIRQTGILSAENIANSFLLLVILLAASVYGNYLMYQQNQILSAKKIESVSRVETAPAASFNGDSVSVMESEVRNKHAVLEAVTKVVREHYHINQSQALEIAYAHWDASVKYGIPIWIGLGINSTETSFKCHQTSSNGSSYGCMQINRNQNFRGRLSMTQLWNITSNIELGYRILSRDRQRYHSMGAALEKYYGSRDSTANYKYAEKVLVAASTLYRQSTADSMG